MLFVDAQFHSDSVNTADIYSSGIWVPCHLSESSSVRRFTCPKVYLSEGLSEGSLVR